MIFRNKTSGFFNNRLKQRFLGDFGISVLYMYKKNYCTYCQKHDIQEQDIRFLNSRFNNVSWVDLESVSFTCIKIYIIHIVKYMIFRNKTLGFFNSRFKHVSWVDFRISVLYMYKKNYCTYCQKHDIQEQDIRFL